LQETLNSQPGHLESTKKKSVPGWPSPTLSLVKRKCPGASLVVLGAAGMTGSDVGRKKSWIPPLAKQHEN
jgi:hypothetical protein